MNIIANPTVHLVTWILAAVNQALLKFPGLPPAVYTVCGILDPVLVALLGGSLFQANRDLRGARAELKALKGGNP